MEAGNINEFIDNLTIQDEMVRYDGYLYYFYGVQFCEEKGLYYTHIDRFKPDIHHFVDEFYYYECSSKADCLEHLLNDKYWDGKSFYEIESQLKWVDG